MTALLLLLALLVYIVISYNTARNLCVNNGSDFIPCFIMALAKYFIPYLGACLIAHLWWLGLVIIIVYFIFCG